MDAGGPTGAGTWTDTAACLWTTCRMTAAGRSRWQGAHGTEKTGKTGKMAKKKSLSGKTQGIWKFCQNTGNFVCSSCKFPDSKGKGYCDILPRKFPFFPQKLDRSAKSVSSM